MQSLRQQVLSDLEVKVPLLNEHLETQAARFAYWGSMATNAAKESRDAKIHAEVVEAQIVQRVRGELNNEGIRVSEWAVMARARIDPQWQEVWNSYNAIRENWEFLQVAREGFAQRKDLLVTIAANIRGEMHGQVRLGNRPHMAATEEEVQSELSSVGTLVPKQTGTIAHRLHELQATFRKQQENK